MRKADPTAIQGELYFRRYIEVVSILFPEWRGFALSGQPPTHEQVLTRLFAIPEARPPLSHLAAEA